MNTTTTTTTLMTLADLIHAMNQASIRLVIELGRLRVDAPAGTLTPDLRAALTLHRPVLAQALGHSAEVRDEERVTIQWADRLSDQEGRQAIGRVVCGLRDTHDTQKLIDWLIGAANGELANAGIVVDAAGKRWPVAQTIRRLVDDWDANDPIWRDRWFSKLAEFHEACQIGCWQDDEYDQDRHAFEELGVSPAEFGGAGRTPSPPIPKNAVLWCTIPRSPFVQRIRKGMPADATSWTFEGAAEWYDARGIAGTCTNGRSKSSSGLQ